jgi:putative ABC transport system permease protein
MHEHASISKFTAASEIPGNLIYWTNGARKISEEASVSTIMYRMGIDYEYFDTFGGEIIAGRGYSREFTADSSSVILNRKAIEVLSLGEPETTIGQKVRIGGDTLTVVGVVENFHQEGLKQDFRQTAFNLQPVNGNYFCLKVNQENLGETIAYVRDKYSASFPENPFDYFFLDTFFNTQYKHEQQFGKVFGFFSMLAIFVASLGLFGLASYTASQRTKEIGIRKVLGSSVPAIFVLLSKDFLKLVLVSNIIAIPIVWYLMDKWLSGFAFRIEIGLGVFIVAAFITAMIALITVSYQSISAAVTNPVKSLRYE